MSYLKRMPSGNCIPKACQAAKTCCYEYLSGWLGGPNLYIAKKGHPRLRMRHAPYTIGHKERDEWMLCMTQALHEQVPNEALRNTLLQQFGELASQMINS